MEKRTMASSKETTVSIAAHDDDKKGKKASPQKSGTEKRQVKIKLYDDTLFQLKCRSVTVAANQILGTRKSQQDSYCVSDSIVSLTEDKTRAWAVVCDGMGGMASGELASKTTADIMSQIIKSTDIGASVYDMLMQSVSIANEEVKKISASLDGTSGTTLVCVVVDDDKLYYASVGDSRIYICRNNEFLQVNRDHNYFLELKEMVNKGEITYEQALADPQKEALISYVGIDTLELIDINKEPLKLQNNDIILLCSDGLTKVLDDGQIKEIIQSGNYELDEILDTLLMTVRSGNVRSLDNTTIALVHYSEIE